MLRKKPGKWFEDENIQRITIKGRIYIYIYIYIYILGKKEKVNLVIPTEKNQKKRNQLVKRKKNTFRAAKLKCKKCSIPSRAK